jgi:hypothetical protein
MIAITLLVVGGYALVKAVDTSTADPGAAGAAPQASPRRTSPSAVPVLAITVTGARCRVYVGVPGGGEVLVGRVMLQGETFVTDKRRLDVVVDDAGAVQIRVNGTVRPVGQPGQRVAFSVDGDRVAVDS